MSQKMSPISFFSLRLEMMRNDKKIGIGTGFVYQPKDSKRNYLVTNYHVLTARDPRDPHQLLPGYPDSPDEIQFSVLTKPHYKSITGRIKIISQESSGWIEHKDRARGVDIVAIPMIFPEDAIILTQEQLGLVEDIKFEVGCELFIVGFPYGYGAGDFFPIWKRGTVASEPLFKPEGLNRFYIDSFTKPGMSGSPVFAIEHRELIYVTKKDKQNMEKYERGEITALDCIKDMDVGKMTTPGRTRCAQLIGVYSGKIGVQGDKDPNIGNVWHKNLIDELFYEPSIVVHPFPPVTT